MKLPVVKTVRRLLEKVILQDNGCILERHELKNHEWAWLGIIKDERAACAKVK